MLERTGALAISCKKPSYQVQNKENNQLSRKFRMALDHSYLISTNSILRLTKREARI